MPKPIPQPFTQAQLNHHPNPHRAGATPYPDSLRQNFSLKTTAEAAREISSWRGYQPTPLIRLNALAAQCGIGALHYKDEAGRFGLGSFKALGGGYAVLCLLRRHIREQTGEHATARDLEDGKYRALAARITVATATDGNHGRAVAWGAARFGCRCRITIHAGVSERRAQAMRDLGAEVVRIRGNYDDSVRQAAADARANGWQVVSDTSYPGYTEAPRDVMAGYGVLAGEVAAQLPPDARVSHIFVQGGVGGLAAAMAAWLWEKYADARPRFIVVEPQLADCLFQSARHNRATEVAITEESVMAGLSCGEPSQLAWEVLSSAADDFLTIPDTLVAPTMRLLACATPPIEAGESAVAGLASCLAACANPRLKTALALTADSEALLLGTEGATDREIYQAMTK